LSNQIWQIGSQSIVRAVGGDISMKCTHHTLVCHPVQGCILNGSFGAGTIAPEHCTCDNLQQGRRYPEPPSRPRRIWVERVTFESRDGVRIAQNSPTPTTQPFYGSHPSDGDHNTAMELHAGASRRFWGISLSFRG
jgi:hypothetical protein